MIYDLNEENLLWKYDNDTMPLKYLHIFAGTPPEALKPDRTRAFQKKQQQAVVLCMLLSEPLCFLLYGLLCYDIPSVKMLDVHSKRQYV